MNWIRRGVKPGGFELAELPSSVKQTRGLGAFNHGKFTTGLHQRSALQFDIHITANKPFQHFEQLTYITTSARLSSLIRASFSTSSSSTQLSINSRNLHRRLFNTPSSFYQQYECHRHFSNWQPVSYYHRRPRVPDQQPQQQAKCTAYRHDG
jgi:hypothetical protein